MNRDTSQVIVNMIYLSNHRLRADPTNSAGPVSRIVSSQGVQMCQEVLQTTSTLAAVLAAMAAIFSGVCAFLSYTLAKKIKDELESDERIIAAPPIHPGLRVPDHDNSVIRCTLFNKSKRKAHIESVNAYDRNGNKVEVTWASAIDNLGNPLHPFQLIGIVDSASLYVRRDNGEYIDYMHLKIYHSFSDSPTTIVFDPFAEWGQDER